MLRRFDFWASRNRKRLSVAAPVLFALAVAASALDTMLALGLITLALVAFVALAVGVRYASAGDLGSGDGPTIE